LIVGRSGCWTEKTWDGYRTASRLMGMRKGELKVIEDIRFRKVEFPRRKCSCCLRLGTILAGRAFPSTMTRPLVVSFESSLPR
jgi:hypothetical protein